MPSRPVSLSLKTVLFRCQSRKFGNDTSRLRRRSADRSRKAARAVWLVVGERPQHNRIDQTENGRRDAYPQGKGRDNCGRQQGRSGKKTEGESDVLREPVPEQQTARLIETFLRCGHVAKRSQRGALRIVVAHTGFAQWRGMAICRNYAARAFTSACSTRSISWIETGFVT